MKQLHLTSITGNKICLNLDQIVAVSEGANSKTEIWTVGSEEPFKVSEPYTEVIRKISSL